MNINTMKRHKDSSALENSAIERRYFGNCILAILLLIFFGCASPRPVTIKHESTPSLSDVAQSNQQRRKEPVDEKTTIAEAEAQLRNERSNQGTASHQESVKNKSVTSEEGTLISGQTMTGTAGEKGTAASADPRTIALLELLKNKNLISEEEAALISETTITNTSAAETGEAKKSVEEIKEEVGSEVTNELLRQVWLINNALKEKDKRLRFGGDIRLRYEKDLFDKNNFNQLTKVNQGTLTNELENTWANQDLYKYRVRFGAEAQVNDQLEAVIRLSTGTTTNPVSTNSTINDYMNKDSVVFDLAYLKWQPWKSLTLYGGRMINPWFSSDLVWASDLNFEGLALNMRNSYADEVTTFLTAGAFPLQQSNPVSSSDFSQHSKWLYAGQVGLERKKQQEISAKIGVAYYYYKNITGVLNDPSSPAGSTDWSAPLFTQGGNTYFILDPTNNGTKIGLAPKYQELNVTGALDIGFWDPVHIVFLGDYVKNLGFNKASVVERTGNPDPPEEVEGYQLGMTVGYPTIQEAGQWKVFFFRKYLEADAVVDAFTDPDFHLGGTNAKGWILGGDIGLAKNFWLRAKWLTADQISGPPLAIDVLQVDFNARF